MVRWWTATVVALVVVLATAFTGPVAASDPSEPRSFTIAAAGDITIMRALWEAADAHAPGTGAYDFVPMFAPIEPWISAADLAICHLEVPVSPDNRRIREEPRFSAPRELPEAIAWAGFDVCSTASNHALDWGLAGLTDTLDVLDEVGLGHSGTSRSVEEDHPLLIEVEGVTVAFGSYTIAPNLGFLPQRWAFNYVDVNEMLADAAWARDRGAEFVIMAMHWGLEYRAAPAWHQTQIAEAVTASGDVDLILGHHVHLVQPIEYVNGVPVVYGMSNFLSNIRGAQDPAKLGAEDGFVVHLDVVEVPGAGFEVAGLAVTPTWVHPETKQILPVGHALASGAGAVAGQLRWSMERTLGRLGRLGVRPAVTPTPWPEASCRGRIATILGTPGDDVLVGTDGDDVIAGRGGDDAIWGGGGDDLICGGDGDDFVSGGDGDDLLLGGDGDDLLLGYAGGDAVWGEAGDDLLSGQTGDDLLIGGTGDDSLLGGPGDDALWAGAGIDRADGGAGDDECRGTDRPVGCER